MSGECDKCREHALQCNCLKKAIKQSEIKIFEVFNKELFINFDQINFEVIKIKRNGRILVFPLWEFWQALERYEDSL